MNSVNFDIIKCPKDRYSELLEVLDRSYEEDEAQWFIKHMGHIFPPAAKAHIKDIENNLICVIDNKIVAAVGVYPLKLVVKNANTETSFKTGGVGSVCTTPDYREKGIMSKMLKRALLEMTIEGYDLSWLGGDRFRYRNYDWDYGGKQIIFNVKYKDMIRCLSEISGIHIEQASKPHIPELSKIYLKFGSYAVRSEQLWERHLTRDNLKWIFGTFDDKSAYICYDSNSPKNVFEIQGDPMCAIQMLYWHMKNHLTEHATIYYPYCADALSTYLYDIAEDFHMEHSDQFRIINTSATFKKLKPFIISQSSTYLDAKELQAKQFLTDISIENKQIISKRLLGFSGKFPPLTGEISKFNFLNPINIWVPQVDKV